MSAGGTFSATAQTTITVRITVLTWGIEISWDMDGGTPFGPYSNNMQFNHTLNVAEGEHTVNYFDSYGDGWHGGYWEVFDNTDTHIVGGPVDGQVVGAGGETDFCVGSACSSSAAVNANVVVTVHIHTLLWANEITWSIDSGQQFGVNPIFSNINI